MEIKRVVIKITDATISMGGVHDADILNSFRALSISLSSMS